MNQSELFEREVERSGGWSMNDLIGRILWFFFVSWDGVGLMMLFLRVGIRREGLFRYMMGFSFVVVLCGHVGLGRLCDTQLALFLVMSLPGL